MACLFLTVPCRAEIIIVDDDLPYDFNNIQAAIDYSSNGDYIFVFPGTYTGMGNRDVNFLGKAITVRSVDPNDPCVIAQTIIDCNGTQAEPHRGFNFVSGETVNSILDGIQIINGYAPTQQIGQYTYHGGGAILCISSNPMIRNCKLKGNFAVMGGGILNYWSTTIIKNCIFTENYANYAWGGYGGGICNYYSDAKIQDCNFTNNHANYFGGAIYNEESSPIIEGSVITGNSVTNRGGGIHNNGGSSVIKNCEITSNSSSIGGGIFNQSGSVLIENCTIKANETLNYEGGGIAGENSNTTILNCQIIENIARQNGGGIGISGGTLVVKNSVISDNNATDYSAGGAIANFNGTALIQNCTIAGNMCATAYGGGIFSSTSPSLSNTIVKNCIVWANSPNQLSGAFYVSYSDIQDGGWPGLGNIDADPYFVDADANDYHLKSEGWRWDIARQRWDWDDVTSRCIDSGNPGSPLRDELLSVPDDPNNEWGQNLRIDMGAFGGTAEASIPPYDWALLADLTNDGIVDLEDYAWQALDWLNSSDQQPGDLNRDAWVDFYDLALLVEDWLEQTTWY